VKSRFETTPVPFDLSKAQGVPTRMLLLPRQPHGPTEPKMMLKIMQTNLEWFEKYLNPPAAGKTVAN